MAGCILTATKNGIYDFKEKECILFDIRVKKKKGIKFNTDT